MNDANTVANLIRECAKKKEIKIGTMLADLDMGINTISQLASGKGLAYFDFARIADYLSVSIDFLLGRKQIEDLSDDKLQLLNNFDQLDSSQQRTVCDYVASLADIARYQEIAATAKEDAL
ncbi:MAG: hypothetical protein IJL32_04420 [Oscillospiraceae bacterium]|nr:hypothetical protein [Oscillospiraceae bacterium]MBQ9905255.1 hypothetical protein [Oscillospiraceae bacterium]